MLALFSCSKWVHKTFISTFHEMCTTLIIRAWTIYDELYSVYSDKVSSFRTVERWSKLFREGWEEIGDEARRSRPITETTFENIEQIAFLPMMILIWQ
jgi:hypothetical protein